MRSKTDQRVTALEQQQENKEQQAELKLLYQALQFIKERKQIMLSAIQLEQQTKSAPERIAVIQKELSQPVLRQRTATGN